LGKVLDSSIKPFFERLVNMKKYQRKVNRKIRLFNKGFSKDISPYNQFKVMQSKRVGDREPYEAMFLIDLYKGDSLVSSKWLDYHEIVGRNLWSWLNKAVALEVNK
jgi:uncharacterized protein (DUF2461 family)